MTGSRSRPAILVVGLLLALLAVALQGVQGEELDTVPSEDQCRPYIERALKDLGTEGSEDLVSAEAEELGGESAADTNENDEESGGRVKRNVSGEEEEEAGTGEEGDQSENEVDQVETIEIVSAEAEADGGSVELAEGEDSATNSKEQEDKSKEADAEVEGSQEEQPADGGSEGESAETKAEEEVVAEKSEEQETADETYEESSEKTDSLNDNVESGEQKTEEAEVSEERAKSEEDEAASVDGEAASVDGEAASLEGEAASVEGEAAESIELIQGTVESLEETATEEQKEKSEETEATEEQTGESKEVEVSEEQKEESGEDKKSVEEEVVSTEAAPSVELEPDTAEGSKETEETAKSQEGETVESKEAEGAEKSEETGDVTAEEGESKAEEETEAEAEKESGDSDEESRPEEEELIMEIEIPEVLRPREHINQLLKLDEENEEKEKAVDQIASVILKDLKRLYDNAIKPLETLYKYRDLSNRHFGDPEIFSKPLVLFMGPWSGGKSSIINYLLDIEYKPTNLRTGAEPSPAYFNILMHGEEEEILDGTQLAADWTFSGLQKFGQGLLDRLKGYKLKNKLLEKVNIVEIPGILEIRKQVQRLFPFNDACQWFIDRADIIFLVYDPAKLDVGPETEAILDQLKGREYQTRIVLNKADQVKPEELMRVQGALIWNISPLMSSAEPPVMYSASLWSIPYEAGAPTRLLYAQERALLRDLRSAIDKRVEHKIASARRFAVRVRNHAKMVDCYLTTYYNHKSFFAKKKDTSDKIIENPQDYHIYEGLSTLTNISRYDLPDPDVYRDFFRLNDLYEFPLLSSTCTYFRGCPINRLDVAIAYDLPELVGKYKRSADAVLHKEEQSNTPAPTSAPDTQNQQQQKPAARSGASSISMS